MNRRDIINELRRIAMQVEYEEELCPPEESDGLASDVLDALADRILDTTPPIDLTAINGVVGYSLVDALEAFVQAGVVRVEVHPAFWAQWEHLCKTFRVDGNGQSFSPRLEIEEGKLPMKRADVRMFEPCQDMLCVPCRYLAAQWEHRMPETPPTPPETNPELN
jgi:hypothetical protein